MTDVMVEAKNVHKVYPGRVEVRALRGIDLTVEKGEMVAIMGPSGCGKTTLLNCLSGLDDVTEGTIKIEGKLLNKMSDDQKTEHRAKRMGFIFQFYNLLPVLSAVENVEMPLLVSGYTAKEARTKAVEMLRSIGLKNVMYNKPGTLSGGERQRVTIARALVNDPAIVWGDELTGDLDFETSHDIMNLVCKLNDEKGATFVIVTHNLGVAEKAHKILRMRSGKFISRA